MIKVVLRIELHWKFIHTELMLHYVIDLPCDVFFFELINVGFIVKKFYQPLAIS